MSSGAWDERVATLTREIASHAQSKQLDAALAAYATIEAEGRIPTKYTHSAIVNAHVNSGDLEGAARALARMEAAGHAPNIIVYTTMLKGHCTVGDLAAARKPAREHEPMHPAYPSGCAHAQHIHARVRARGRSRSRQVGF